MVTNNRTDAIRVLKWCRCKSVAVAGDVFSWTLAPYTEYEVLEAYRDKPHFALMQAQDDDALRAFMRNWGPLRLSDDPNPNRGSDSVAWYRAKRDFLVAVARLLESIERPGRQREALAAFLEATKRDDLINDFPLRRFSVPGMAEMWLTAEEWQKSCETASSAAIASVCAGIVEGFPIVAMPSFRVVKKGRRTVIRASLFINNLWEALVWMVWQDVFREDPILFCWECGQVIDRQTRHARKFHDARCAKRYIDRKSASKKRAKEKKRKGTRQR
jgi:hypothetical protein